MCLRTLYTRYLYISLEVDDMLHREWRGREEKRVLLSFNANRIQLHGRLSSVFTYEPIIIGKDHHIHNMQFNYSNW